MPARLRHHLRCQAPRRRVDRARREQTAVCLRRDRRRDQGKNPAACSGFALVALVFAWTFLAGPRIGWTRTGRSISARAAMGRRRNRRPRRGRRWGRPRLAGPIGQSYAAPVVAGDQVFVFHRVGDERLDCLRAADGKSVWTYRAATHYRDDFGFTEGPRGRRR